MEEKPKGKRDVKVNAFKAPVEWYEAVKIIASRRHSTISSTIIRLVELGAPLYETLKESEPAIIAETLSRYKKLRMNPVYSTEQHKQAAKRGT